MHLFCFQVYFKYMENISTISRKIYEHDNTAVQSEKCLVRILADTETFTEELTKHLLTEVQKQIITQRHRELLVALESKVWEDELAVSEKDMARWRDCADWSGLTSELRNSPEDVTLCWFSHAMAMATMTDEDFAAYNQAMWDGASSASVLRYSRSTLARLAVFIDGLYAVYKFSAGYKLVPAYCSR